ncbi:transcription factor bHLH113-like [Arachis stenosperma]|uniref:transcription factor bHLH113-like n=1 Tax=Arachis stenosperma TaxID=217475 RepID=UPI0025AC8049|nr:transcription factor bHLH113-like [Arachis stenosperma]
MEAKVDFEVDNLTTATGSSSFSQLLFGDDDDHHQHALGFAATVDHYNNTHLPLFSIDKPPKMLSFGDFHHVQEQQQQPHLLLPETNATPQKSVITSSDSSSASSCNHTTTAINSMSKTNSLQKKRNWPGLQPIVKVPNSNNKKNKTENPPSSTSSGHAKQKKEKLGERIAALQQLVSPFGKTDTASVLHEAMGYIRFLHDQVQVLCSPYLQRLPSSSSSPSSFQHQCGEEEGLKEDKRDLKSMGLCLIPLQSTLHVSSTNGADFWSPAAAANNVTPYAK